MRTAHGILGSLASALLLALGGDATGGPLDTPGATKALMCSACHGFEGNSPSDTMPIIAGMAPAYFKKAIGDYAAGRRPSPEMEPYAKMTLHFGVDDIAAFFAAQRRQPTPIKVDASAAARGKAAVAQCVACHGPEGKGDPARLIPDLTGQPPGYLRNQMLLFKSEQRSPVDEALKAQKAIMRTIPDQTLADLAAYYSSLR
ncbi:MAG: c-type cytochrome [Candidatus Rokuibacteriota bacterium]